MKPLIDKVAGLLPLLEERGTIYLYALTEQEDLERWDVVMSSAWSDQDWMAAVRWVADLLKSRLLPQELTLISRIAVIPSHDPRMQDLPRSLDGVMPEDNKVVSVSLLGSEVRRAFIFKAQHPPMVADVENLAAMSARP